MKLPFEQLHHQLQRGQFAYVLISSEMEANKKETKHALSAGLKERAPDLGRGDEVQGRPGRGEERWG